MKKSPILALSVSALLVLSGCAIDLSGYAELLNPTSSESSSQVQPSSESSSGSHSESSSESQSESQTESHSSESHSSESQSSESQSSESQSSESQSSESQSSESSGGSESSESSESQSSEEPPAPVIDYGTAESPLSVATLLADDGTLCAQTSGSFSAQKVIVRGVLSNVAYSESYKTWSGTLADVDDPTKTIKFTGINPSDAIPMIAQNDTVVLEHYLEYYNNGYSLYYQKVDETYDYGTLIAREAIGMSSVAVSGENASIKNITVDGESVSALPSSVANDSVITFEAEAASGYDLYKVEAYGKELTAAEGVYSVTVEGDLAIVLTANEAGVVISEATWDARGLAKGADLPVVNGFASSNVTIGYDNEFTAASGGTVTISGLGAIKSIQIEYYNKYNNFHVYEGTDATGTEVVGDVAYGGQSATSGTDNKGYLVNWTFDNDPTAIHLVNGYSGNVSFYYITVTYVASGGGEQGGGEETVAVTGVTVSPETLSLGVGETSSLTATVSPENASNKEVVWASDDENVATVADGVVTGVAAGTANITATSVDGSKVGTCVVTVTDGSSTVIDYGTAEKPLSVGTLLADDGTLCAQTNGSFSAQKVIVKGVLSDISYSENYKTWSGTLADVDDSSKTIKFTGINASDAIPMIAQHDTVVIEHWLEYYSNGYSLYYKKDGTNYDYGSLIQRAAIGNSAVTVTASNAALDGISVNGNSVSALPEAIANDSVISFSVKVDSGYKVSSVKVNGVELVADAAGIYMFALEGNMSLVIATAEEGAAEVQTIFDGSVGVVTPSGYTNSYTGSFTATVKDSNDADITLTYSAINNGQASSPWTDAWRFGRKTATSVVSISTSVEATALKEIVINLTQFSSTGLNSVKVYTSADAATWTEIVDATSLFTAAGEVTIGLSGKTSANLAYKLEFDMSATGANGSIRFSTLTFRG